MLGRESAIKVLPLHKSTQESTDNFRREIRAQAKLDHPNLVRAFDAGEDGNVHYLVVEYVPGTDLRRLVRSKGMLTVQQAAHIIMQAARGLEHAHSRGLIHRDIKPGNILVTTEGNAKVSDLGLAGHLNETDERRGKIVGTADYLAPEQIRTPLDVTKVADIYSLGCTLYYAITGKVPFPGGNAKSKARRHLEETPWHPRRFNAEVSDEFVDLIGDMMEKNPRERIQSAAEVAERLSPWAADDSPIIDPTASRARWTSRAPAVDGDQDTDPGANDVAEMALGELSGSEAELSQGTIAVSDSGVETSRIPHPHKPATVTPPPPPVTATKIQLGRARSHEPGQHRRRRVDRRHPQPTARRVTNVA
jgi:serine/threonine protein kinase